MKLKTFRVKVDHRFRALFPSGVPFKKTSNGIIVGSRKAELNEGVYRFRNDEGYAKNFAKQWKQFQTEQYDHINGTTLSRDRIADATKWNLDNMQGELILEAGCGAGRFTRLLAESGAYLVSFDYSSAVNVSKK